MKTLRRLSGSSGSSEKKQFGIVIQREKGSFGIGLSDDNTVTDVAPGSAAAAAGLLPGDVVVSVDAKPLDGCKLASRLAEISAVQVTLGVERAPPKSSRMTPRLSLSSSRRNSADGGEELPRSGSFAAPGEAVLTMRLARSAKEELGLDVGIDNVVTAVMHGSVAELGGLQVGDVVTKVDGQDLEGTPMPNLQADIEAGRAVMISVRRGIAHDKGPTFTPRRNSADL